MKNWKYLAIIIIVLVIVVFGALVFFGMNNSNESKNQSESINVYEIGDLKISSIKTEKSVNSYISQINNRTNFTVINIEGIPKNSTNFQFTAYQINGDKYGILINKKDNSEAVFIESSNKTQLVEIANSIDLDKNQIDLSQINNQIENQLTNS